MGCKCTLAQRTVGDGCDVCNPTLALEYAREEIESLRQQLAAAQEELRITKEVEFPRRVEKVAEGWRAKLAAALAACDAKDDALELSMALFAEIALAGLLDRQASLRERRLFIENIKQGTPAYKVKEALAIKPDASALKAHDDALIERIVGHLCENGFGNQNTFDAIRALKTEV